MGEPSKHPQPPSAPAHAEAHLSPRGDDVPEPHPGPEVTVTVPSEPPVLIPPAAAALLRLLQAVHRTHTGADHPPDPSRTEEAA